MPRVESDASAVLPFDRPRNGQPGDGVIEFALSATEHAEIVELARTASATPLMVVHAVLAVVLARISHRPGVVIDTPSGGGALPLRLVIDSSESCADLLARVGNVDVAAFVHTDMRLTITDRAGAGMDIEFRYPLDRFDSRAIGPLDRRFRDVLAQIVADPEIAVGDVDLLDDAEWWDLVESGSSPMRFDDPHSTLVSMFTEQVLRTPNAVAVCDGEVSLTYRQLSVMVNQTARLLISHGVGPDSLVVLGIRRSLDLVVAMYSVLVAGGTYVPVDPEQPATRTRYIIDTVRPVCVLTTSRDARAFAGRPGAAVIRLDRADRSRFATDVLRRAERNGILRGSNAAYVMFASGSTRPKGVAVTHAALVNQIEWVTGTFGISERDVVLFATPATRDESVWEVFGALARGARLVVAEPEGHLDPAHLRAVIAERRVTIASFAPAQLAAFAETATAHELRSLRTALVASTVLAPETARAFKAVCSAKVHHLYGPSEFTVTALHAEVQSRVEGVVPIGRPVWNSHVFVLDSRLHHVPAGVVGELYLTGAQLARGYLGRGDLTAAAFVANPFGPTGTVLYRTGDLVRWNSAGELVCVGRNDFQAPVPQRRLELDLGVARYARPESSRRLVASALMNTCRTS